eukprot:363348-Chlamydomonas_euryale.AAC.11
MPLLHACSQNLQPCLWWADNGMRIGTFEGHNGAVWSCDFNTARPPGPWRIASTLSHRLEFSSRSHKLENAATPQKWEGDARATSFGSDLGQGKEGKGRSRQPWLPTLALSSQAKHGGCCRAHALSGSGPACLRSSQHGAGILYVVRVRRRSTLSPVTSLSLAVTCMNA